MISTTTPSIEGRRVQAYKGIVFGEVITGISFIKDWRASFSSAFGGRSPDYEEDLIRARQDAVSEMEQRAADRGANAVIGVDLDYEVLDTSNGSMLMVTASGTAVVVA